MTRAFIIDDSGEKQEIKGLTCDLTYPNLCPLCVGGKIRVDIMGEETVFEVIGVRFESDDNGNDVWTAIVRPVKESGV